MVNRRFRATPHARGIQPVAIDIQHFGHACNNPRCALQAAPHGLARTSLMLKSSSHASAISTSALLFSN
eukprot:5402538-Prymnesium_polylepis.1